jgi:hypothetical protein
MTIPLASAQNLIANTQHISAVNTADSVLATQYSALLTQIATAASQGLFTTTYEALTGNLSSIADTLQRYGYTTSIDIGVITVSWGSLTNYTIPPISGMNITSFNATVGDLLVVKFKPIDGVAPYSFTVSGNTPPGTTFGTLTNVNYITLTGTPTTAASEYATLTIVITDSIGQTFSQDINWTITRNPVTVSVG